MPLNPWYFVTFNIARCYSPLTQQTGREMKERRLFSFCSKMRNWQVEGLKETK